jgi:hypothetical protein
MAAMAGHRLLQEPNASRLNVFKNEPHRDAVGGTHIANPWQAEIVRSGMAVHRRE